MSQSGRPVSGFARPGSQSGRPGTMEQGLRTPRTSRTARPVTSASGRFVRLGTVRLITKHSSTVIILLAVLVHRNKFSGVDVVNTRRSVYQPGSAKHSQIRSSTDACQGLVRVHLPPRKRRSKRKIVHAHLLFYFIDDYRNAQV